MRRFIITFLVVLLLLPVVVWIGYESLQLRTPEIPPVSVIEVQTFDGTRVVEGNWYRKNRYDLWEAYIHGEDYYRGEAFGYLAKDQIAQQEDFFVAQIRKLIPSKWFLKTLKFGVSFFNRNMDDHVIPEYQRELYGISGNFSDEYGFIGPKYARILNYHAAHDIGHALQDLSIVGCSAFALKGSMTVDGSLLIGRNFDFYMGDDFSKNKLVLFNRPENGIPYASVTWAGFMGVVSGINAEGLTVTLNASKSSIPNGAKTPISLLAREILQYASNIDEAIAIAEKRETFVSESIMIGSRNDGKAVVIEKSPQKMDVYDPKSETLICTNHYQSDTFKNEQVNLHNIRNSDSNYRSERLTQLLSEKDSLSSENVVNILRERKGVSEVELGLGNPKAINQLLSHHGIVFQPDLNRFWISTAPWQMGKFLCYDLDDIFSLNEVPSGDIFIDSLTIDEDPFVHSQGLYDFMEYKKLKNELFDSYALGHEIDWTEDKEQRLIASNPESYVTYMALGDYYADLQNCDKAKEFYSKSLAKEVASLAERAKLEASIKECND